MLLFSEVNTEIEYIFMFQSSVEVIFLYFCLLISWLILKNMYETLNNHYFTGFSLVPEIWVNMYLTLIIDSSSARKDLHRMYWCSACFADDRTNFGLSVLRIFLKNKTFQLFMIISKKNSTKKNKKLKRQILYSRQLSHGVNFC